MRDAFARTVYEIAKADPRVFVVVADISPAGSMASFRQEFPNRFVNVGVAEQTMIGLCGGLALRGYRPFAYTIATFALYRPFEQIRDDLCYQDLPVTVVGVGAGLAYSTLGGTHHAQEDVAVLSAVPNMAIIAPCDPRETAAATRACMARTGPTYLRLGKAGEPDLTGEAIEAFEYGKARRIKDGADVCILSYGPILRVALEVAARVERERKESVAVASVHTLKPLDVEGIEKIVGTFRTVAVIEEHSARGSLGSWVKEIAWDRGAKCEIRSFGLRDEFLHVFGTQADLWRAHGLGTDEIFAALVR